MKVLLIGSGGREHALAWKIAQSEKLTALYCLKGNPKIEDLAKPIDIPLNDYVGIVQFCQKNTIDLVVIGPEQPLIDGLSDKLREKNIAVFGPSQKAAQLEGSKSFAKDFCRDHSIPIADYCCFNDAESAKTYLQKKDFPIVIKADGLAAGKGVIIAENLEDSLCAVNACFDGSFGKAGHRIVIEDFLEGEEISFFCLCDGKTALAFGSAQDYKRLQDNDLGPNTGGMGAYSPASMMNAALEKEIMDTIIYPTLKGLQQEDISYQGVIFAGLMLTKNGIKLIEYNVRFGDPETQVLMKNFSKDILPYLHACACGELESLLKTHNKNISTPHENYISSLQDTHALTIVLAAKGYPYNPKKGDIIKGLDVAEQQEDITIFYAGTKRENNQYFSNGGRVLNVTALGSTPNKARENAYKAIRFVELSGSFYRSDIGKKG